MSTPAPVARPRVPIRRLEDGTVRAECQHCPFTRTATFRAEIELDVSYHREQHRRGDIEVTR